ncbi:MAG: phospholipase, partial [Bacteroidota bacterium]
MIHEHSIPVTRTAHYATQGQVGPHIRYLCIACHGYGQLAARFIRKFDVVDRADTFVIAPEGLSRFYWGGVTGNVVAS